MRIPGQLIKLPTLTPLQGHTQGTKPLHQLVHALVITPLQQEHFQNLLQGWAHDYPAPENWVDGLFNTGGPNNHFGCESSKIDTLLAQAKVNLDNEKRIAQYREINRLISEEICGMAPLFHNRVFSLVDSSLKGSREYSTSQDHYLPGDWAIEEWYLSK